MGCLGQSRTSALPKFVIGVRNTLAQNYACIERMHLRLGRDPMGIRSQGSLALTYSHSGTHNHTVLALTPADLSLLNLFPSQLRVLASPRFKLAPFGRRKPTRCAPAICRLWCPCPGSRQRGVEFLRNATGHRYSDYNSVGAAFRISVRGSVVR